MGADIPAVVHLLAEELARGLPHIQASPKDQGVLDLIVVRPGRDQRTVLDRCEVSFKLGVHGDDWAKVCWKTQSDGTPHPEVQVAIMNSRCVALLAQDKSRWPLAGDNLFVDFDLSEENLRPGQRLAIGTAVLEITAHAHNGCGKFSDRYGKPAVAFVNSPLGKRLHLRGIYAKVVKDGLVSVGDCIRKLI